jgi:beta-phosphoglucomutase-like phosphatase (HAD superfamily)
LFDLDGTLVDSVHQHDLAWHEAMQRVGIDLAVWTIHHRIGMSGGLMANAILHETGHTVTSEEAGRLIWLHAETYARLASQGRFRAIDVVLHRWRPTHPLRSPRQFLRSR